MRIDVMPFAAAHLDDAGRLLAVMHADARRSTPELPARYEEAAVAAAEVSRMVREDGAVGYVALAGQRLVGYLLAKVELPRPGSVEETFLPERSARARHGWAVAAGELATEAIRALYAAAAPGWPARGCFTHTVTVPAEPSLLAAWRSLGFGLVGARGLRRTDVPLAAGPLPAGVRIRRMGGDDAGPLAQLLLGNARHHAQSPPAAPLPPGAAATLRRYAAELLSDAAMVGWIAADERGVLGGLTFQPVAPEGTLTSPPRATYLGDAYTMPMARGTGITSALLAHALTAAAADGFEFCAVSWDTPNIEGRRFWLGRGFRPINHRLARLVDPRIVWARPGD